MPRYHFHTGIEVAGDPKLAIECANIEAAKALAVKYAGEAMSELGAQLFDDDFSLKGSDDNGLIVLCIHTVAVSTRNATISPVGADILRAD